MSRNGNSRRLLEEGVELLQEFDRRLVCLSAHRRSRLTLTQKKVLERKRANVVTKLLHGVCDFKKVASLVA